MELNQDYCCWVGAKVDQDSLWDLQQVPNEAGNLIPRQQQPCCEHVNEFLFWDSSPSTIAAVYKPEDEVLCCDLAFPTEPFEHPDEVESLSSAGRCGLLFEPSDYLVPTFTEGNECGCALSIQFSQLKAELEEKAAKDNGNPSLQKNTDAIVEQSIALSAQATVPLETADDKDFIREFDARVEEGWIIVGRGKHEDADYMQQRKTDSAPAHPSSPTGLKPALKNAHRPSPLRRVSNPPPPMIVEGQTPKNADDADQTCDNFKLFWEKDPNMKTPTLHADPVDPAAEASFGKSVSFKDKKSAQCLIYVEPEDDVDDEEVLKLDDDKHTFDNFDRLWEKDPRFMGDSCMQVKNKIFHELEESDADKPESELLKIDPCDMIQKHIVTVVNQTTSSGSSGKDDHHGSKANLVYDPVAKMDRKFSFDISYELHNQNEEEGTADKTIRNAIVNLRCEVQVQVVLKVEPMQDPERKFLYTFNHNIKVLSDFKLETEANVLHKSTMEVVDTPAGLAEPNVEVTHHKVKHHLVIAHRWATATTPRHQHAVLQRRMSASSSHSRAHQDFYLSQQRHQQQQQEEQNLSDEGEAGEDKALRRSRSQRRSLQRSNSK